MGPEQIIDKPASPGIRSLNSKRHAEKGPGVLLPYSESKKEIDNFYYNFDYDFFKHVFRQQISENI